MLCDAARTTQEVTYRLRDGRDLTLRIPLNTDLVMVCDDGTPILLHTPCGRDYAGNRDCPRCLARRLAGLPEIDSTEGGMAS